MSERPILVCMPTNPILVIPGSLPDKCSRCGQSVMVSPSSWQLLHDNPDAEIICVPCVLKMDTSKYYTVPPNEAQREDMKLGLKKEVVE